MNISSLKNSNATNIYIQKFQAKTCKKQTKINDSSKKNIIKASNFNLINFTGYASNSLDDLKYNPITKTAPIYKPIGDYKNLDIFCEEFSKKLETQLMNPDIKDVKQMILRLSNRTQAPMELILEVLYRLTQFSSYDSISAIEKVMNNEKINFVSGLNSLSINTVLYYLLYLKFELETAINSKYGIFLDDILLKSFEEAKNNPRLFAENIDYQLTKELMNSDIAKIIILDGFDVKASNEKYYSAGFLSGSGYLESLALDVIKKVQQGEKLDDVLNQDLIERFKKLYPDFQGEFIIAKKPMPKKITPETILENLKTRSITKEEIKKQLNTLPKNADDDFDLKTYQRAIMKYLDNFCIIFSPASFQMEMKKANAKLNKLIAKSEKKPVFYIPDKQKSYGIITYMFAKCNNIPAEQTTIFYENIKNNQEIIILDDASISGESIEFCYDFLKNSMPKYIFSSSDICFFPIVTHTKEDEPYRKYKILTNHKINEPNEHISAGNNSSIFTQSEKYALSKYLKKGFKGGRSGIIFPYLIPDNSPEFIANLFNPYLYKSTISSNKGFAFALKTNKI